MRYKVGDRVRVKSDLKEKRADDSYAGKPSKEELFSMPTGTKIITNKGNEYVYDGRWFTYKENSFSISYFNNDLSFIDVDSKEGVAEIQIPEYKTVWKESRKKMTLKEIEKELGYPVEIVEEEN